MALAQGIAVIDKGEFTCALTQSSEPIISITESIESFKHNFVVRHTSTKNIFLFHQAQEETENHIIGTPQMENSTADGGQDTRL